jgi:hypothetical protein
VSLTSDNSSSNETHIRKREKDIKKSPWEKDVHVSVCVGRKNFFELCAVFCNQEDTTRHEDNGQSERKEEEEEEAAAGDDE